MIPRQAEVETEQRERLKGYLWTRMETGILVYALLLEMGMFFYW